MSAEDDFKERARRKLEEMGGEGEDGSKFYKFVDGPNVRRFLPIPARFRDKPSAPLFYFEFRQHSMALGFARCLTTEFGGKKKNNPAFSTICPCCRRYNKENGRIERKYGRGNERSIEAWKVMKDVWLPRQSYVSYTFGPEDDEVEVMPTRYGDQIMQQLLAEYVDGDVKFWSIKTGVPMNIKRKHKGGKDPRNVGYTVVRGKRRSDVSEVWEAVKDDLPSLDDMIGAALSVEQMEDLVQKRDAMMEDDDEEERPRRRSSSSSKKGEAEKPSCFGDEETHDPNTKMCEECPWEEKCAAKIEAASEEDSDDEEDEKPAKKKLKVVKDRLKRRAGGRDEEDDEEEEDDDE